MKNKICFLCIGNINRSRAAEAIFNSLKLENYTAISRGLLPSNSGKKISDNMNMLLTEEEKKYVSKEALDLTLSDIKESKYIIIMDYYVLNLLNIRFSPIWLEDKVKFFTSFFKDEEPFIPIKDPYKTNNYLEAYNDIKKYMQYIVDFLQTN